MTNIKLLNVEYGTKDKKILDKIDLEIKNNEMISIMGPSGSGKTTLINILGLIEKIHKGKIIFDGVQITKNSQKEKILKNKISYIFQNYALIENKTVMYNISIADNFLTRRKNKTKMIEALQKVGLTKSYLTRKIATLSGGEQQRVAIARAIYRDSKVIIADEPTGNLDEKNALNILQIFKQMQKEGKTIIIVTHENRFNSFFDQIYFLEKGKIVKNKA